MLEIKALVHDRIERLEQAFLHRKRQRHQQGVLLTGQGGHALELIGRQNFPGQAFGPFHRQQMLQVHAQPAPLRLVPDNRRSVPGAVGDGTTDMPWPDRGTVFADGRDAVQMIESLQRFARAQAAGEKFRLALGDRALDARGRRHIAALKIAVAQ